MMTRDARNAVWWEEMTADDTCGTAAQIEELLQTEPLDTARIGRLWSLLFILGQEAELKDLAARIRSARPPDCGKDRGAATAWIGKYEKLIAELKDRGAALSDLPGDYASVAQSVESLDGELDACRSQIGQQNLRDARPRPRI